MLKYVLKGSEFFVSRDINFTLLMMTEDGLLTLYPKTTGSQVILPDGTNLIDHINSDEHVNAFIKDALDHPNAPGGYVVLDENGKLPTDLIRPIFLAIKTEFADINDMLTNSADVLSGGVVMVMDASGDPNVDHGWAVYRRKPDSNRYWELVGWECIAQNEEIDVTITWDMIQEKCNSTPAEIDQLVADDHTHTNKSVLDKISDSGDEIHPAYDGHSIALDSEVSKFFDKPYVLESEIKIGDIWIKESYAQNWWKDTRIEDAGDSCFEMYMGYDTIDVAPKVRTGNSTNMTRMFCRCYDMEETQQYQTDNVQYFTGMYYECTSLKYVPIMNTMNGINFDSMFYRCLSMEHSPEMQLNNATSVIGMYNACELMEYILPFGSTANVTNMARWFKDCSSLKKVFTPIDFSSITQDSAVEDMFSGCIDLEELEFVDDTVKVSLSLENTNLSVECLLGILQGLPSVDNSPTLTLTDIPNVARIDESEFSSAISKGWNIVR